MVTFENANAYNGRVYCFHTEPVQRDVMGYKLSGVSKGDVIPQGTPIVANDNDTNGQKTAKIAKYAKIKSKTSTTKFVLESIGRLAVGDKIFKSGQTSPTLSTISAIDTETKEITLSAANAQLAAGDIIVEGQTVGSGADATVQVVDIPNRIIARTETMRSKDQTISATHQAIAIKNVLDYPQEWLNSETFPGYTCLKGCPLIMFINQ